METLIMTTRVSLLILVTGTFTALWSGDHPERIAAADRPTPVLIGRRSSFSERVLQQAHADRRFSVARNQSDVSVAASPLPEGIAAGMYLVTDQWGRTQVQLVEQHAGTAARGMVGGTSDDHYVVEQDGFRWHYIRLDDSIAKQFTQSSSIRHN